MRSCLQIKVLRKLEPAFQNVVVDGHGVLVAEGINAGYHFVEEDSHSPPVDRLTVSLVEEDFGG